MRRGFVYLVDGPCIAGFVISRHTGLCSMKKKLDLHRFEREDDATILNAVEHSSIQQRSDVTVYGLYIPLYAACRFADGNGTGNRTATPFGAPVEPLVRRPMAKHRKSYSVLPVPAGHARGRFSRTCSGLR
jgi:hypothetical protein